MVPCLGERVPWCLKTFARACAERSREWSQSVVIEKDSAK
ncbi:MAG: hypothetical protein OJF47_002751 [Nitrospira sp.]|nr:MAG: hypothetical protein OJF47_002751 [Nitrospira sp.]